MTYQRPTQQSASKVMPAASAGIGLVSNGNSRMGVSLHVQRKCEQCKEEEEMQVKRKEMGPFVQRKAESGEIANEKTTENIGRSRGGGQAMDEDTRTFMESRFASDFSGVRIHSDNTAAGLSSELNAKAFTTGKDIYFNQGQYQPDSEAGKHLLAHELTHVVQQNNASNTIQRKLDCDLDHLTTECGQADASCKTVQAACSKKYPTAKEMEVLHDNAVAGAKSERADIPNAADNLLHFLSASGKEKVMPIALFKNHSSAKDQLKDVHRDKFIEGAKKRLASGALVHGGSVDMVWTDTANAFNFSKEDLGLAVGGYTLCSKVTVSAVKKGADTELSFDSWTVQAFDCYNWDPGKGIGSLFGGVDDTDLCCLQNASKGKHYRIRTDAWKNDHAPSLAKFLITVAAPPPAPTPVKPPSRPDEVR